MGPPEPLQRWVIHIEKTEECDGLISGWDLCPSAVLREDLIREPDGRAKSYHSKARSRIESP